MSELCVMSEMKKIEIGDWRIRDDEDGEYVITHKDGSGAVLFPSGEDQSISERLFWRFIRDLLCGGDKLAAAPDLYEALEAFERAVDLWLPAQCRPEETGEVKSLHALREKMLSVLAKARGES